MSICKVCNNKIHDVVYTSEGKKSFNSSGFPFPGETKVLFCSHCGHLQTEEFGDIAKYYSDEYNFLIDDEDEDQIYRVDGDKIIYRSDHQLDVLLQKLNLRDNANILDFGCAKATLIRKLKEVRPDLNTYLYDISGVYTGVWDKIVESDNYYSTFRLKEEWNNKFDVVLSFFSMEHVTDPQETVKKIHKILKENGTFYFIIPNPYGVYKGDILVIDHINHFSDSSLNYLLQNNGFEVDEIDDSSHELGIIVKAKKVKETIRSWTPDSEIIAELRTKAFSIGEFWKNLRQRIKGFESENGRSGQVAIYGAALYGSFIAASLSDIKRLRYFIDRNPFKQGRKLFDRDIISPEELPEDIGIVYVGLSPGVGQKAIEGVKSWQNSKRLYFFL